MTYYSFTWRKTVAKTVVFTNVKVVIYKIMNALVVKLVDTKDLKAKGFTNSIVSDTL